MGDVEDCIRVQVEGEARGGQGRTGDRLVHRPSHANHVMTLPSKTHFPHAASPSPLGLLQESRGVEVSRHVFSGSGHCEHYRRYPHEYALQVSQFVSKALERW